MLMPRKVAHRKHQRGRMKGNSKGGNEVTFGDFGIQALEPGWITARQIEAARIAMTRHIKRGGKFGSIFSQINPLQKNQQKLEWVQAKETLKDGWLLFAPDVSYSSFLIIMRK